ncbi:alkane 1-monooxygenase [Zhongshania arctica]|uniref:Alkane 1-monooxygenase n=1 Tax=Zhongshania arctica TaxID=3238302 RepID=A0ABV3TXI0_9GAMM
MNAKSEAQWRDPKRYLWSLGLLVPLFPVLGALVYVQTGQIWGWWLTPLIVYLIIPALDFLIGTDHSNPPESAVANLEADNYYKYIVYAYIPLQYAGTLITVWFACTELGPLGIIAGLFSCAYVNGIGINTGHELGHKRDAFSQFLAKLALAPVAYGHFYVEHNFGHHRRVATPEDPASSKMGESFWRFLPRTVIGSLRSACEIEAQRLERKGLGFWHWRNDVLQAWAMTLLFFGACTIVLGWMALVFLVVQAVLGASLLEVINYVEHYGLLRQKDANGRYERCLPKHSWNSNHIVTNLVLYQLQRHSDHHAHPSRAFQALRHFDDSPQLPSGYASMMMLAYFPPLWFKVMNPRVVAHHRGDFNKANVHPAKIAKLKSYFETFSKTASA